MKNYKNNIVYCISVIIFLIFIMVPILWCFIISISFEKDIFNDMSVFFPKNISFINYLKLLNPNIREGTNFLLAMKNSIFTSSITVFIGTPLAVMCGYSFARFKYRKGIKIFMGILLSTMIIPFFTTIIPLYTLFAKFNLLNSIGWLAIIYISSFLPMVTWITTNYFKEFPIEIEEMALIDGCTRFQVIIKILLPNVYPIILTGMLIIFLRAWSQYQLPLILAASRNVKPLTVLLAEFSSKDLILYGQIAAAGILTLLPPMIFSFIFRKYLISGLTKGVS
ncbi:carbohydrate ABC transporter permease [Fusobacterium mortiferum]|uniref:carbohydrate ABC transporter permease n=1 Tax=Fusobacterium mortiferum TaxID=850 RepID=UPI00195C692D|nr:carbohydrate ABC transporter permease [Fusobacterium mortiferum]